MDRLLIDERENAKTAIEYVRRDSILGWGRQWNIKAMSGILSGNCASLTTYQKSLITGKMPQEDNKNGALHLKCSDCFIIYF